MGFAATRRRPEMPHLAAAPVLLPGAERPLAVHGREGEGELPGEDGQPGQERGGDGERVVRLKGGDPSIFGRLEEELQALAEVGIACEVIPGVTAAVAAAAQSQRPLTRRGQGRTVALTTAMTLQHALQAGHHADTEVFYMAGRQLAPLSKGLLDAGWPGETTVSVVSRAGWPDVRHSLHTVASLDDASVVHAGRPTLVIVGAGATEIPDEPLTHVAICGETGPFTPKQHP